MSLLSVRRIASACAISAATVAALAAPGMASAEVTKCNGSAIKGQGSSLQKLAQVTLWGPAFNTSICPSGPAKIEEYNPSGSGAGLKSWGSGGTGEYGPTNAYIGTDQPPNAAQEKEIEEGEGRKNPATLLTIPVLQAAVAVLVHLPAGCTATSTEAPGRLVLSNTMLEAIFAGKTTEWGKIKEGGDKFIGASCPILVKKAKIHITRVVREDGSGTTATFKKYLFLKVKSKLSTVHGSQTWNELAEENPNTFWPVEGTDAVVRAHGGSGLVAAVAATPTTEQGGFIGYANLADARGNAAFQTGTGTSVFWTEVENGKAKYADPANNGEEVKTGKANCEGTLYTNGKKKFPPPDSEELWNEVNSKLTQTNYTICGFTYDLAFNKYSAYTGTTENEARTVFDYLGYETSAAGGQTLINEEHDYLKLPTSATESQNVQKIAAEGAAKIAFTSPFKP